MNFEEKIDLKLPFGSKKEVHVAAGASKYELRLDSEIGDAEDYSDWLRTIRATTEHDVIELHLCTPGGSLSTTMYLLAALRDTPAHKHVVISGMCASGGTILMMCGDSWEIDPHTQFLFHNYRGMMGGKHEDMKSQIMYMDEYIKNVIEDVFGGFLTKKEQQILIEGKEHYMLATEVGERLEKRTKHLEKEQKRMIREVKKMLKEHME